MRSDNRESLIGRCWIIHFLRCHRENG